MDHSKSITDGCVLTVGYGWLRLFGKPKEKPGCYVLVAAPIDKITLSGSKNTATRSSHSTKLCSVSE